MHDLDDPNSADPASGEFAAPDGEFATLAPEFACLAGRYDLVLCDVWGVLHDGLSGLPLADDALARYRRGGGRVILVSNAPRPGHLVAGQLDAFGVSREAYDGIVTSGDLTRSEIRRRGAEAFFHIGPPRDLPLFEGLEAVSGDLDRASYVVCTGLDDDESETVADYVSVLRRMRERDLPMVCANPDLIVERGHRLITCAGALAAAYEEIGGSTFTAGKPHRPIYEAALAAGEEVAGRPIDPARILAVGDAIRTDVAGARAFGIDVLLLARGIHALEMGYAEEQFDSATALAWIGAQAARPTHLAADLRW